MVGPLENIRICRSTTVYFPLISLGRLGRRARISFEGGWGNEEQRSRRNETRNYPTSEAPKANSILEIGFFFLSEEMGNYYREPTGSFSPKQTQNYRNKREHRCWELIKH